MQQGQAVYIKNVNNSVENLNNTAFRAEKLLTFCKFLDYYVNRKIIALFLKI